MKRQIFQITIALLWLLINGCHTTQALSQIRTAQDAEPLLLFQKSPCLGPCPAYDALLYEDGSIHFVEFKNALAQDTIRLQLPEKELGQLKQKLRALNYKSLQNSYPSNWSDISSTNLTFYEDSKEVKQVRHEKGGPAQLVQFQEWLHQEIWQRAEEEKRPTY